jgi:hypothetical protein
LKRLREQAQLKLDAYQQSIISSNYPGISGNYDSSDARAGPQIGITGMGDSPTEEKPNQEDDKLAVLGTATRVLEGKLRQNTRNHSHGYNKHSVGSGGGNNCGSSKSGNSPYGSLSGLNPGSASSSSTSYPYAANLYSPTFGQQQTQAQGTTQTQQAQNGDRSASGPVYSASTPTAQTLPFAMGKGAMPVNIGCVDQSLADLLAEVSSPNSRDPTISGGSGALGGEDEDEDSAMMYFNMPSGNTPVPGSGGPHSGGSTKSAGGTEGGADNAFSTFSFSTGRDGFKAPRNPLSSSSNNAPISLTQNPTHTLQSGTVSQQQQQANNTSTSSSVSSSYTALPDAGVSPSSGLDFGTPSELGGISTAVTGSNDSNSNPADNSGGSSFLSSIPGLLATSPNASSYGGYTPDGRRSSIAEGMPDMQNQQQRLSHGLSSATLRTSNQGASTSGTHQQAYAADRRSGSINEDSYLDTAWMDYFPTPGVGLFPQSTGLLFGASSGATTPNGINPTGTTGQFQSSTSSTSMLSPLPASSGGRGSNSYPDSSMQYQQQQQPQPQQQAGMQQGSNGGLVGYPSPTHQQQMQEQQQSQQQQRNRYLQQQPGPGGNNMNTYRVYDDLFGSVNNRY